MKISLPDGVEAYKKTAIFDQKSLPEGFRKNHNTKQGVWAVIHVLEGKLRYVIADQSGEQILTPENKGIIFPEQIHRVEAIGKVSFYVEFHR